VALLVFVLLVIVLPLTELYVFVQVAQAFGFWWALLGVVATTVIGAWLVKRAGLKVWRRFNQNVRNKAVPAKEVVDGLLLLIAGALFLFPGFVTDAFALLFLFPPTRAVMRNIVLRVTHVQPVVATYDRIRTPISPTPPTPPPAGAIDVGSVEEPDD